MTVDAARRLGLKQRLILRWGKPTGQDTEVKRHGFGSSGLRIKIGVARTRPRVTRCPREGDIARAGWWSRLDTCQDYFFSVSQQYIDRLKASIREQTNPLHRRQPVPDAILIVRRIAEEAIIVAY